MGPIKQIKDWFSSMPDSEKQGLKKPTIEDEVNASFARDRAVQRTANETAAADEKRKTALEAKTKDPKAAFGRGVQEKLLEAGY